MRLAETLMAESAFKLRTVVAEFSLAVGQAASGGVHLTIAGAGVLILEQCGGLIRLTVRASYRNLLRQGRVVESDVRHVLILRLSNAFYNAH